MKLTPRKKEVLELIWEGHGHESIANQLGISRYTVHKHVCRMLRETGTNSTLDMAMSTFKEAHEYIRKESKCD